MNTTQIKAERQTRDEQNVLAALSDDMSHVFSRKEHLAKTVRSLARRGVIRITHVAGNGDLFVRKVVA